MESKEDTMKKSTNLGSINKLIVHPCLKEDLILPGCNKHQKAFCAVTHVSTNQKPLFSDFNFVKRYCSEFLNRHIALTTYVFLVHKKVLRIFFMLLTLSIKHNPHQYCEENS